MVDMTPVASSNLAAVGYDSASQQLYIQFHSGGTYVYSGVTDDLYQSLMAAASKGSFFHHHIKIAGFPCQQI